ncbi:MAG: HAD family hydrolase [Polaromonas sp.]|nr:HAD family hydrolase [Polaromonas sp.]
MTHQGGAALGVSLDLGRSFDALMIDLDGTLVDTLGDFVAALNLMLEELPWHPRERALAGLPLTSAAVESMVGKGSEHLIQSALMHVLRLSAEAPEVGTSTDAQIRVRAEALYAPAWASYQRHYLAINGLHASLYPGVVQGLQQWHAQGLPMACLTNKPLAFAQQLLKLKGLDGYFSQVFGGDSFERKKPDPMPLLKTCEALRSTPARTLMLGDSSNDARAARAAGCPVVLVTYGYNHGQPIRAVDADGYVDSFAELTLR